MDVSIVLRVKALERVLDNLLRIGAIEFLAEHCEEHGEVDRAGRLLDHALQVLLGDFLAKRGEHIVQVVTVDEAVAVLIDHVERLLELLQAAHESSYLTSASRTLSHAPESAPDRTWRTHCWWRAARASSSP